jgi:hypothetical protein
MAILAGRPSGVVGNTYKISAGAGSRSPFRAINMGKDKA